MAEVFAQFTFPRTGLPCRIVSVGDLFVFEEKHTDAMGAVSWRPAEFPSGFQPLEWPEKWASVSESHYIQQHGLGDARVLDLRVKAHRGFPSQSRRGVVVTYLSKNNHAPDDEFVEVFAEVNTSFGRLLVPMPSGSVAARQVLLGAAALMFAAG